MSGYRAGKKEKEKSSDAASSEAVKKKEGNVCVWVKTCSDKNNQWQKYIIHTAKLASTYKL